MAKFADVRFPHPGRDSFHDRVVSKVNAYFRSQRISPYANAAMWFKTACMLLLYFVPYFFMMTGFAADITWLFFLLWFLMGLGMVGIGTSVMHDANHGTYSPKSGVNHAVGSMLEVIGGYVVTWKIQHNVLHHTYTNVAGLDEDINSMIILRFSPHHKRYWFHRYQHIYAWFFYSLMTLFWMTLKDYLQVLRYKKHDLLVKQKVSVGQALFRITVYKIFYYGYVMILPIVFSGMPWYYVVLGFLLMHFTAGLFLAMVFQPAHIMSTSEFSLPVKTEGKHEMENSWAIHEMNNTTNFAPRSKFLNWFIGGLNFQIEHHLFTGVCHVHYRKIAPMVREAALEFGVPYHVEPTFWSALKGHVKMLRILGRGEEGEVQAAAGSKQ